METNQILTKRDLFEFEQRLFSKLKETQISKKSPKYLRSKDVCEMLSISQSTLQNLRNKNAIPYKRIGGTLIYGVDDVETMMSSLSGSDQ